MVEEQYHLVEIIYVVNTLREAVNKKCAYCSILMNLLNFKTEFKNFTDFKNVTISDVRSSKILFAMIS